ncbi:MAG: nucleotidyltransferase [Mesorhizobium sp.]|uniref:nucleotidyltransferase domain-containing protein n=1 Tax=Mesorhizobium sp. TaxID=1871066 RepID=UPI00122203E3|nr:nucleotidyltransferase [Mesorhizobium sp.]TIL91338.1 MAG: nucleotidyltransferase [Mesorhizobium sp.]
MNYPDPFLREIASYSPLDVLLVGVAVRIQPTPTDHKLAEGHYHAIHEWLDRDGSPLKGRVELLYAQGGFSIGSTTARHAENADFDIDAMAQLAVHPDSDPEDVLSLLHTAIKGEPGTRYWNKTDRKTRCVTVLYEGMHLDVTPAVRARETEERISHIYHSKKLHTGFEKGRLLANPYGFADWFNSMTPPDRAFGNFFEQQSLDYERMLKVRAQADAEPVPDQAPAYRKSRALIALQLIKRWRNLAYDARHSALRLPPSVLLAYSVASNANCTRTLSEELQHQVACLIMVLETADRANLTYRACNPRCEDDELTDRWPENVQTQRIFIDELRALAVDLERLQRGLPLSEMRKTLERLFGEKPAQDAVRKYMDTHVADNDSNLAVHIISTGSVPALGSLAAPAYARHTPKSNPFGD